MCKQKFSDYNKSEKGMFLIGSFLLLIISISLFKFVLLNPNYHFEMITNFLTDLGGFGGFFYHLSFIFGCVLNVALSIFLVFRIFFPDTKEEKERKLYRKKVKKENKDMNTDFIDKQVKIFELRRTLKKLES